MHVCCNKDAMFHWLQLKRNRHFRFIALLAYVCLFVLSVLCITSSCCSAVLASELAFLIVQSQHPQCIRLRLLRRVVTALNSSLLCLTMFSLPAVLCCIHSGIPERKRLTEVYWLPGGVILASMLLSLSQNTGHITHILTQTPRYHEPYNIY